MPGATRDQFALVSELVDHGGLALFELDAAGNVVTEADTEGLTENEIDDLVASFAYETTEVGRAVAERLNRPIASPRWLRLPPSVNRCIGPC